MFISWTITTGGIPINIQQWQSKLMKFREKQEEKQSKQKKEGRVQFWKKTKKFSKTKTFSWWETLISHYKTKKSRGVNISFTVVKVSLECLKGKFNRQNKKMEKCPLCVPFCCIILIRMEANLQGSIDFYVAFSR